MCKTIEITEKRCSKCGEVKPVDEFNKHKGRKYGLTDECKVCRKNRRAKYYEKNRKIILERCKIYGDKNREKIAERNAEYRAKNRKKVAERKAKYYYENKEIILEKEKKYRANNKEKIQKRNAKYRDLNHDMLIKRDRKYREMLSDVYIKTLLVNQFNFSTVKELNQLEIAPQLIELKRISIQSKRILNHKKLKV